MDLDIEDMQLRLNTETLEDILRIAGVTGISVDTVIANVLEKALVSMKPPKEGYLKNS